MRPFLAVRAVRVSGQGSPADLATCRQKTSPTSSVTSDHGRREGNSPRCRTGSGDLLANWLYGVARRTAARARVDAPKRRAREAAPPTKPASSDPLDGV